MVLWDLVNWDNSIKKNSSIMRKTWHVEEELPLYHKDVQQQEVSKTSYPTEWTNDGAKSVQLLGRALEWGCRNFRKVEEKTLKGRRWCIYKVFGKVTVLQWLANKVGYRRRRECHLTKSGRSVPMWSVICSRKL